MTYVFEASNVRCSIMVDGERRTIFSGLSFAIEPGEIVDLVGPSGAGKSSLLTAFARLNPRASGDLRLDGRSADDFTPQQWRAQVAYLPQKPVLLGETVAESETDEIKALSEKLEIINLQLARRKAMRRSALHWGLIAVCVGILAVAAVLAVVNSPYLGWDYSAPETAVMGVAIHAFEWGFVRLAPFALIAAVAGMFLTRKRA